MEEKEQLVPKVVKTALHGQGEWLQIQVEDLDGLSTNFRLFSTRRGSYGEVTFEGINQEFVRVLITKLTQLLLTWEISS